METVTLNNGVEMPALGLGVFQTPPDETRDAVRAALSAGYRHIDTAAAYGNERQVGEAVHGSELDRSEVFLETKIWISDYGYDETLHGFEKSARKLGVEEIDLLILPRRCRRRSIAPWRPTVPWRRCWLTAGSARSGSATSWSSTSPPCGKTPAQVMLRWGVQHGRSVIPKSTRPGRIAENIDVFNFELSADEIAAIDGLDTGRRGGPEPDAITLEAFGREIPET